MFLSPAELRELTDYQRPADQRRWLDQHGIPYWIGASGRPKVLRSALQPTGPSAPTSGPDWRQMP